MSATKCPESADFEWAVGLHRSLLTALGTWPEMFKNPKHKKLIYLYSLLHLIVFKMYLIAPSCFALFVVRHHTFAAVENLQTTVPLSGALIKHFDLWRRRIVLIDVVQMIRNDWEKPKAPEEWRTMMYFAQLTRTIFKYTVTTTVVPTLVIMFLPLFGLATRVNSELLGEERPLIFQSYYFVDLNKSPAYEVVYGVQMVATLSIALTFTGVDNFLILLIMHTCGQLRNLQFRMLRVTRARKFNSAFIANVKEHIRLIRTINTVDDAFALIFCELLLYFAVTFCLYGMLILYFLQQKDEQPFFQLLFSILVIMTMLAHAGLFCLMGEMLVMEAEGIYSAVCECDWQNLEPKDAKRLMFVMLRASKPMCLTAGKIIPINLTTFCQMLKMSGGYISVLLARLE